jgi:hypothetical protein
LRRTCVPSGRISRRSERVRLTSTPSALDIELVEAEAWVELQLASPEDFRRQLGIHVERVAGGVLLLADRSPVLVINRTLGLGLAAPLTEPQLDCVMAAYAASDVERFIIQWSPAAAPATVSDLLERRGFRLMSHLAKVYRSTAAPAGSPPLDRGLRIVEIDARAGDVYEQVVARPLGVPRGLEPGIRSTIGHPGWRFYLVYDGDRPIAGAASYRRGRHAWFGLGATIESDRRRGAQSALLARRIVDAAADGCDWVSADTITESPDKPNQSYRNMCHAGFVKLYDRPNYLFDSTPTTQPDG